VIRRLDWKIYFIGIIFVDPLDFSLGNMLLQRRDSQRPRFAVQAVCHQYEQLVYIFSERTSRRMIGIDLYALVLACTTVVRESVVVVITATEL